MNITDSNECFGTQQFPELADLVNCGYATVNFYYSGSNHTFKSCFYIPDNHLSEDFQNYFKLIYIQQYIEKIIEALDRSSLPDEEDEEEEEEIDSEDFLKSLKSSFKKSDKRKLQSSGIYYELVVEDKFGKKYKYTDSKAEPEIIEEGMQGDKPYGTTPTTPVKDVDYSKMTLTNFKLLIFLISLILA